MSFYVLFFKFLFIKYNLRKKYSPYFGLDIRD